MHISNYKTRHLCSLEERYGNQRGKPYVEQSWAAEADAAALEAFGRPLLATDYRISGIACEEFSEARKNLLREHARSRGQHRSLAAIHAAAANSRRLPAGDVHA